MLRLRTYLAPSVPAAFFRLVGDRLAAALGEPVELSFDERTSGPLDPADNPFVRDEIDLGFVCAPSYHALRDVVHPIAAPVPTDPRAHNEPVYFSDVVVRSEVELATARWALNDRASLSGYFSVVEAYGPGILDHAIVSGSHLASLDLVASGRADAAAIDSNVLRLQHRPELRIAATLGPFPIQPVVARRELPHARLTAAFLSLGDFKGFGFARFEAPRDVGYERPRCSKSRRSTTSPSP